MSPKLIQLDGHAAEELNKRRGDKSWNNAIRELLGLPPLKMGRPVTTGSGLRRKDRREKRRKACVL